MVVEVAADRSSGRGEDAVMRAMTELRKRIKSREFLPGEHIRQEDMAQILGISRVPVREALKALSADGAIVHHPNQGYFVAKMSADEVAQIYRMRELLETEVLSNIVWPNESGLRELRRINEMMGSHSNAEDVSLFIELNHELHFRIFDLSPTKIICSEIERLWARSEAYRALYHYSPEARLRIIEEHDHILDAVEQHELSSLISWSNTHRSAAGTHAQQQLG